MKKHFLRFTHFKNLLFESILTEGKHWPEDYKKTAINTIKNSKMPELKWYYDETENYSLDKRIEADVNQIIFLFEEEQLNHKNSNLGYFSTIIKWLIEQSVSGGEKGYESFGEKLTTILRDLRWLSNSPEIEDKIKDDLKKKWTLSDFEKFQEQIHKNNISDKIKPANGHFNIIGPIESFEEMNKLFGGNKTGFNNKGQWCHTNTESIFDKWTQDGKKWFFVITKDGWENIVPPNPKNVSNAYDDYGTSLIALLVDIDSGKLDNATLRWNHFVKPYQSIPGTDVDNAFFSLKELDKLTDIDVSGYIGNIIKDKKSEEEKFMNEADSYIHSILENAAKSGVTNLDDSFFSTIDYEKFNKATKFITKLKIPEGITSIGNYSFEMCEKLESVELPNTLVSINDGAFVDCKKLTTINIPDSLLFIGKDAFENTSIHENLDLSKTKIKEVSDYAFSSTNIKKVKLPNTLEKIEDCAFMFCKNLDSIVIPNTVKSIEYRAFIGCEKLKSIAFGNHLEEIGPQAFSMCTSLKEIVLPNSILSIGTSAFSMMNKDLVIKGNKDVIDMVKSSKYIGTTEIINK